MNKRHYCGIGISPLWTLLKNRAFIGRSFLEGIRGFNPAKQVNYCHPELISGSRKIAFTLAEVLITLGIIGVVAALTMPTLISNNRKKEVETKLAKVYSVMNQAIKMSSVINGEPKDWAFDCGLSSAPTCSIDDVQEWFKKYLGNYLQVMQMKTIEEMNGNFVLLVYLNDGTVLEIPTFVYDIKVYINAKNIDNAKPGRDIFYFRYNPNPTQVSIETNKFAKFDTFEPYTYLWDGTREGLFHDEAVGKYGCGDSSTSYCAKLIQYNGWKIPDDYPFKF